ncbi:30S ribosome-binding factor RbfA [Actinoalloteichus hymeniacidonis]|uniref:Ribosome-binding factor A n=1 Tax=Actinoalloteichus hymeniacidonis TaxID=340345 RepID=A0AAC9MWX3_9PSEU|nr:30S ribosome-binding factor RbfA [Actinoalloteichus hymeniacidonis]AOS62653.1 ribosome-binding factor A [Actinoalloteichus hymeniacidonis]MBB5909315.1 ribosome-binding factor A [Actinoalloteichus hymeniacidonis]
MADVARARRLAKRIAQIVASALEREVKDPRLARVTITDAKVTPDLRDATLYYTVIGESVDAPPDVASAAAALESAKGVLRSLVGQQTGIRFTPTLTFAADTVPEAAKSMDELLARAREADAEVARLASGATFAGEADPYKSTDMDDDEEDLLDDDREEGADSADGGDAAARDAATKPRDGADSER